VQRLLAGEARESAPDDRKTLKAIRDTLAEAIDRDSDSRAARAKSTLG